MAHQQQHEEPLLALPLPLMTSSSWTASNNNNNNNNRIKITSSATFDSQLTPVNSMIDEANRNNIFRTPPRLNNNMNSNTATATSTANTPSGGVAFQNRQAAWWQSSVVRRSSSAVDEAVDELTEKSQFLLRKMSSHRNSTPATTPRTSSSNCSSNMDNSGSSNNNNNTPPRPVRGENLQQEEEDEEALAITPLHREEILTGRLLGEGTFSCVYEVVGIELTGDPDEHDQNVVSGAQQLRRQLATAPPGRFALKHLKSDLLANTKDFEEAATDLVMEAKYLGAMNHPNILKLRGQPVDGTAAFANRQGGPGHYHDGYFLLTDRLTETLARRIERWASNNNNHMEDDSSLSSSLSTNTIACKTRYALQIADALHYLHERRIIFRDLKPSNIGFNAEDQVQLFDFGLCRELPPPRRARPYRFKPFVATKEEVIQEVVSEDTDGEDEYSTDMDMDMDESWNDDDDDLYATTDLTWPQREEVYFMSGAGTLQYMAPEILLQSRYNLKADVYSWAMTFTEMLLLEKPLPWYSKEDHIQYICREGDRPCLPDGTVPDVLRDLLAWAWDGDVAKRCTIAQARQELQDIMAQINQQQDDEDVDARSDCPFSTRLVDSVGRMQEFLFSILQWSRHRLRSLLQRTNSSNPTSDNSSDVSCELTATIIPAPTKIESLPEATATASDNDNQDSASTFRSLPTSSNACLPSSPTFQHIDTCSTDIAKAAPNLWRKRSSLSTTTLTDDECEYDKVITNSDSFPGSGTPGGGIHAISAR